MATTSSVQPFVVVAAPSRSVTRALSGPIHSICRLGVGEVHDGNEALRITVEGRPIAVVLDLDLPGGGITVAECVHAWMPQSRPKLIVMLPAGDEARARGSEFFDHVLLKPVHVGALVGLLASITESSS